jgi:pectate lyase
VAFVPNLWAILGLVGLCANGSACTPEPPAGGGTGGAPSGGASATGGTQTTTGGTASGGAPTGGKASGGMATGGTASGGAKFCGITAGTLLAFPGAQGFGKNATGARTGTVYHVTNLNDSGAGSFRDAVSASNRFVVFDVGGYIQLATAVSVKSNITIAGQTAPGGGIGFRGGEISFANSSNIICRYLRIRPGSETAATDDDALSLYRAQNVMIDHSSFEFAPWNNIDAVSDDWQNYPVTNVTFQDSLIADPTGQQFGAHTESVSSQMAWYRNIFANSHNRNPLAKINTVFVNNLLYNYSAGYTTHTSTSFKHDILNNYFVMGPASTGTDNTWYQVDINQSIYYSGNLKDTNLNGTLDGSATTPYWYQGEGTVLSSPWSSETNLVAPLSTASAARVAMSIAGPLPRDPIDALIISQAMTLGKGTTGLGAGTVGPDGSLYTSQAQTGLANNGYGSISGGTKPTDTDNDGMPDNWENATGSNPSSNDAMTKAADGYALVERYVNWLAGPHATTTAGTSVDVELGAYATGFSSVSPTYSVSGAVNGTVALGTDGHTARFQPTTGCYGLGSFSFTVNGSDGTAYTSQVVVLVVP